MPSQLPSSFASAAAGQNRDSRGSGRGDSVRGSGSGEWSRSNGTRTFRRPSTTPFNQSTAANATEAPQNSTSDVASLPTNNQTASYENPGSFRTHDSAQTDASNLYMPNWNPSQVNGSSARGWGKSGDSGPIPQDPTVCWDPHGAVAPIGLDEMSPEERELFAGDVNSTLKIPQQNKDGVHQSGGPNGRKSSVSANTGTSNYPISSPSTASRPGTRRRETTETNNPFPSAAVASPTASRFSRDDPWLSRRGTDLKESITDEPEQDTGVRETPTRNQSFTLGRGNIIGTSNFGSNPASLWGPASGSPAAGMGAFGNFALGSTSTIGDKRQGTGGSRLAHLIPAKDSAESPTSSKAGTNDAPNPDLNRGWRPRQRTDTDPFGNEDAAAGSAILGGAQDNSPPSMPSQLQRGNVFDTPVKGSTGDFGMSGLKLGNTGAGNGPASPSETNPYRSPLADRVEDSHDDADIDRLTHAGPSNEPSSGYNTLPRSFGATAFDGSDRSQTSSVGAKGFPTVNTMTGWPAPQPTGTPDRERQAYGAAFGSSIFNPLGDIPTTGGLGGLGGVFGAPSSSGLGRGSKLGSLFPQAMQNQTQGHDHESLADSLPDLRQGNPLGAIGRGIIGAQTRDTGSPIRAGGFADLFPDAARSAFTSGDVQPGLTSTTAQSSNEAMAARTMVMPDRMRWVYLDPQGTMQGPFNGLEMNDWYKANFFTPDLRVKRLEDPDFEPLGQLIRRIGNSREPFLVPQMGVPHGPAPPAGSAFAMGTTAEAVPPLQSAFPSFGRTLTAAQQNDLERRKQEEQLYHARQRELVHHHHPLPFNAMRPGIPALHHHSSAHSLQSQPSFGSISSPIGMAPQPAIGPIGGLSSGFFDGPLSMAPLATPSSAIAPPDSFAPDLNFSERQMLANMQLTGNLPIFPQHQVRASGNENAGLRSQLPGVDQLQTDSEGFSARLKEFVDLRAQHDAEQAAAAAGVANVADDATEQEEQTVGHPVSEEAITVAKAVVTESPIEVTVTKKVASQTNQVKQELSLTERVRKTQADAAAAAAVAAAVAAAAVAKPSQQPSSTGLPMPFPPPQQSTPLAAPTAQRPASNLPSRYGERSATGTPDTSSDGVSLAPPPTAPWAVQPGAEAHKGPSLKEIQEAEAKKAAKREEAAAAMRRAALEQEAAALREREKAAAANVGLPATSTWGTGSPVGAPATGSPWKQPTLAKTSAPGAGSANTPSKKTLAEIQREEEELRKQKARQTAAKQAAAVPAGKRYAELASKASAPPGLAGSGTPASQPAGGGWINVGAGGKVKIPTGPAAQTRSASATIKVQSVPAATKPAPKATIGLKDAKEVALEEFKKWLHRELSRGLVGIESVDSFAGTLLEMGTLDPELLSAAVYQYSTTMDGRHFAEEFVRRKKLADKGVVEKESSVHDTKSNNNGGWNEVAKKGGSNNTPKEDTSIAGAGFKQFLRGGQYVDILTNAGVKPVIQLFVKDILALEGAEDGAPTPSISFQDGKEEVQELASVAGIAAFNAFLQINVTGPVLEGVKKVEKVFTPEKGSLMTLRKLCLKSLDVDGVSVYPYIPNIELFCLARWVFGAPSEGGLKQSVVDNLAEEEEEQLTPAWLALRVHVWHYKLLTQPSLGPGSIFIKSAQWSDVPSLEDVIEKQMGMVEREVTERERKVQFLVEKANDVKAKEALKSATELSGFVYALSGAMAKRTKWQEKSTSQLVVLAKSSNEVKVAGEKEEAKPEALRLNDDTLLESLEFSKEGEAGLNGERADKKDGLPEPLRELSPDEQPQLSPLDQIILLSEATLKDAFSPADSLTSEEILPFASTNWQIYTQALLTRRTVERGVLQMQAVVDQAALPEKTVEEDKEEENEKEEEIAVAKPTSFFPAAKPSETAPAQVRLKWHLEAELAYSWAGIFKRLRIARTEDEDGRGSGVLRWRLFHRTGSSGNDQVDEDADISSLKSTDFQGPERSPSPPNAPRLFCILGDIENDPAHYERAWEISRHRFSRAQRSLGEYYLQQKDVERAREAYEKAVKVNRLSSEMWGRLGDINLRLGNFSDAAEAFGRAIAAADNVVGGEDARTWSNLGSALYSLYVERVKELKKEKEQTKDQPAPSAPVEKNDDEEDDDEQSTQKDRTPLQRDPATLLSQALSAYKRGASIARENWRIWDNVLTLAARLRPVAVSDMILALNNIISIRKTEETLDIDVLRLLLNEAVLSQSKPEDGSKGIYEPPRGTHERAVCELLENTVVPLITSRSELWEIISRERVWRPSERAWRAAVGTAGLAPSSAKTAGKAWKVVVERTDDLVSALENYGEEVPEIGSAIRSVLGKAKENWEGTEEWDRLKELLDGLR
ncbi:gyf domain containing protein [Rhypophila sp. PSN 637]